MPAGKPAGVACVQLDAQGRCKIFGQPQRPAVCASLQPAPDMCGNNRQHAMHWLARLEAATAPDPPAAPAKDPPVVQLTVNTATPDAAGSRR